MNWISHAASLLDSGGWAMYPLLALSLLSLALSFERGMFWLLTHGRSGSARLARVMTVLREQPSTRQNAALVKERGLYAMFARDLLTTLGHNARDHMFVAAVAHELVERYRSAIERFSNTMSTIITAAPMLGILGTVSGIISSFRLIGAEGPVTDPTAVAGGIAEALLTTAFGLLVALLTLFPYTWSRAQSERCISRLEAITAAAAAGPTTSDRQPNATDA
jgi:biopolymer transport protein ExbB